MKRSRLLAAASLLLLAGCIPIPIPIPVGGPMVEVNTTAAGPGGTQPPDPESCARNGGSVRAAGRGAQLYCVIAYRDAGTSCTDGDQCAGDCWTASQDRASDGKIHGRCQPDNTFFGCHGRVESGKLEGGIVCLD